MSKFLFLLCAVLSISTSGFSANWTLNDMTLIFPLPLNYSQNDQMFSPTDSSEKNGEILPLKYMDELFKTQDPSENPFSQKISSLNLNLGGIKTQALFSTDFNNGEDYRFTYPKLRVVGMRIDPCFKSANQCFPQIRLIWQPLSTWGRKVLTDDAAIHSFYTLSELEFKNFMKEYSQILIPYEKYQSQPQNQHLQIHPIINQEGLSGPFMNQLKKITLKYCGENNIWRVTAMKTFVGGDMWAFFGYDVQKNAISKTIEIPRLSGGTSQIFRTNLSSEKNYSRGDILPRPSKSSEEEPDLINLFIQDSSLFSRKPQPELLSLGRALARIENPDIHSPETLDCLTCHAAHTAGLIAQRDLPWLRQDPFVSSQLFKSSENLQSPTQPLIQTKNLRALGYF
ncbi:MAG TPA: hypothetical protein PLJ21_11550, partial [Pseudobdellovibrionaceae bacterium]|nr:hypothetical protein [Pseudobdellovibrionaceae bacterium]